ncbi:HAUS augmin-like complex subunit 6 N-terminus-domain-containing protein [Mariannaea sp. PMI_226]|nr:HAUS augmin-like complex subunit 6 N-terminus-domain-containing protein [Mariannaea sp. PMI_226]
MAAVQHTRTRSARLIANLTRPGGRHVDSSGDAPHATGPPHRSSQSRGPSALQLFLTNLRLLDFDLRPDWPGIGADTFATGGLTAQGQKKRVQCVEWALYHLFAIWDPEETRNKLKPFFPPLDQVQSVNLRAALLRALELAKKNGALGKDAIVRKTMLDECKGERLEEVLAAFSSAVLKLVMSQETSNSNGEHAALAIRLALEDRGYKSDNSELVAMVWAHKAALNGVLRSKQSANTRFRDFSELLDIKTRGLARKNEAILAKQQSGNAKTVSDDAKLEMWRTIRNNWSGNERWMETLLYGDTGAKKDSLLGMPYDRVWRRVQQGRLAELEDNATPGLLEQLDGRVRAQKERLDKWETFQRRLCQDRPRSSPSEQKQQDSKRKGIDLGFGAHEALSLGRASPRKLTLGAQKPTLTDEYHDLVRGLEDDLLNMGPKGSSSLLFLQRPAMSKLQHQRSVSVPGSESVSEVSELDDDEAFSASPPIKSFPAKFAQTNRQPVLRSKMSLSGEWFAANTASAASSRSSTEPVDDEAYIYQAGPQHLSPDQISTTEGDDDPTPVAGSPERRHEYEREQVRTPEQAQIIEDHPYTPQDISPSPTQDLADQILESMEQATPSPTRRPKPRHTLSLADRTRLSMARGPFTFPEHEEPDLPLHPVPVSTEESRETPASEEYQDLISRTRKSMAGFEKAKQKAQLERRRSLRKSKVLPRREGSYFPKVAEEEDRTLLAEELMGEEDMEAVFRSRPKIKASPLPSPTREWDADEYM